MIRQFSKNGLCWLCLGSTYSFNLIIISLKRFARGKANVIGRQKLLIRKRCWYPTHVRDCIIYTHCFSWHTRMGTHEVMAIHKCHNGSRKLANHFDPYQNKIPHAIKLWIKVLHFIILINCHINFKANVARYFFWI